MTIRINVNSSKKRPGPEPYSSDNFMAGLECEFSSDTSTQQLHTKLAELFALTEKAVDDQLARAEAHAAQAAAPAPAPTSTPPPAPPAPAPSAPDNVNRNSPARTATGGPTSGRTITTAQARAIAAIGHAAGLTKEQVLVLARRDFGVESIDGLSVRSASRFIDSLQLLVAEKKTA